MGAVSSSSPVSFGGLASGINTNAIINALLSIDQQPITALQQQSATLSTEQGAISQIRQDATSLQQAVQALTLGANVAAKTATTNTPSSQPAIVSAIAGSGATNGSFQVTVKQLATATQVTSSAIGSAVAAIGNVINLTAPIGSAGFGTAITPGTFTINGKTITISSNSVLDDPNNASNSIVNMINSSGAGVTASIVNDAYGRPNLLQIVSAPGRSIQLGSSGDTSNFLSAIGLLGAAVVGNTATSVTGGSVSAGALSATITVDGTNVTINQTSSSYTGAQNAAYIVNALNAAGLNVTAAVTGSNNDQIMLTQKTPGSQETISVNVTGTGAAAVALTNGTYQNGTDRIVTPSPVGRIDPTQSLGSESFTTALAPNSSGGGTIQINGVSINWSTTDSLNDVINRINASGAQVQAAYDPLTDRLTLTATQTGGGAISLQDTSGNLLEALHLMSSPTQSVAQQVGQNAVVDISSVNNGQDIVTSSNNLNGYVPGVNLTLLQGAPNTPVTVTVSSDTTTTVNTVQNFVNAANTLLSDINKFTATSATPGQGGTLAGDPTIEGIAQHLESLITQTVIGGTPGYQSLNDVGVSLNLASNTSGSTVSLQLDTTKLTQALQSNPSAVQTLFAGLDATLSPLTLTSGTGGTLTGVTGQPSNVHLNGTYTVTVNSQGNAQAQFQAVNGETLPTQTATLTANTTNSTLIPGVSLSVGSSIQAGTYQFGVTWNQVGAAVSLNDYLNQLLAPTSGLFASRSQEISNDQQNLSHQISNMQQLVASRQQALQQQFAAMESTLALLQAQGNALSAELGGSGSSSSSSLLSSLAGTSTSGA